MIKIKYKINIENSISNMDIKMKESSPFEELMLIAMLIEDLAQRAEIDDYKEIIKDAVKLLKNTGGKTK